MGRHPASIPNPGRAEKAFYFMFEKLANYDSGKFFG